MGNPAKHACNVGLGLRVARSVLLVFIPLIGCGGGDSSAPANGELRVVAGANQSADVGSPLPSPIVAQVLDPVTGGRAGVHLRPRVLGGGSVTPAEATTDADGKAAFTWTLANSPGLQQMVIEDLTVTLRATVSAIALAPVAVATVSVTPGDALLSPGQTQQFAATLRDATGAALTGRSVAWTSTNPAVASVLPSSGLVTAGVVGTAIVMATSESKFGFATVSVSTVPPPPVATSLRVVTQPAGALSGVAFTTQPVVEILDQYGARLVTATTQVTAARGLGTGTLGGTLVVAAVGGVATFTNISLTGAGVHSIAFSAAGLAGVSSESFTIGGGSVATNLVITTQPSGAVVGADLTTQPVVEVRASSGALVTGSTAQVTATVASANGAGSLTGATTVTAVNGVARFTNLRMNAGAGGVTTLNFASTALSSATSAGFAVSAPAAARYALNVGNATPASVQAGQNITIPIVLDLSSAAGGNVGAVAFSVSWDATKFGFVSGTVNGASGFVTADNTSNAVAGGTILVSALTTNGVITTRTLYTIVLTAKVTAANSSTVVNASVSAAGDGLGDNLTIVPRNLTVIITP
jgi:hypothetical protein